MNNSKLLTLHAHDFHVEVSQSSGDRQRHTQHSWDVDDAGIQVVEEGSVLVVVTDKDQLGPCSVVCPDKAKKEKLLKYTNTVGLLLKVIWSIGTESEIFQENSHLFDFHLKAYYVCTVT